MIRVLSLVFLISMFACSSSRSVRKRQSIDKRTQTKTPASSTSVKEDKSKSSSASARKSERLRQRSQAVFKAAIFRFERLKDDDPGFSVQFSYLETIEGPAIVNRIPKGFTTAVSSMKKNFPWITDYEYNGSIVYIYVKQTQGEAKIIGFSEKLDGEISAYHSFR